MEPFNHYFVKILKERYAQFDGRATRSEYWYFILYYFILSFIMALLDTFFVNPFLLHATPEEASKGGILGLLLAVGLLVPSIAVAVRRLHDIGKSGWWLLLGLVPVVGVLVLIYLYAQDSQKGENAYGRNPKEGRGEQ